MASAELMLSAGFQYVSLIGECVCRLHGTRRWVDTQPIQNGADLAAKVGTMPPGTAVKIGFLRNGNEHTVSVTLGELPVTPFKAVAAPPQQEPTRLGLALAPAAAVQGAGTKE